MEQLYVIQIGKLLGFRNLQEKLENIPYILDGAIKEFWDTEATSFHCHRV